VESAAVLKRGARPWGRERVARALTREESRERSQIDVREPARGKHPDNPQGRLAAFCTILDVKYLLTRQFPVEAGSKIHTEMATHAVIVRSCLAGLAR
jgi:hypothetical protein